MADRTMQIIAVKRAHPREERLGYLSALIIKKGLDWELASSDNLPDDGSAFVHTSYKEGIEKKFRELELILIDVSKVQYPTGNCEYGAIGTNGRFISPDDDISTVFDTGLILGDESIYRIKTSVRPTQFSFLYFYKNEQKLLLGPFQVSSSNYNEQESNWDSVFNLIGDNSKYFPQLKSFSVYSINSDLLPNGLMLTASVKKASEPITLAVGLQAHIKNIPVETIALISNEQLIRLIDDVVQSSKRLGRKGKRELLKEIEASSQLRPILKSRMKELFSENEVINEELVKALEEIYETLTPSLKKRFGTADNFIDDDKAKISQDKDHYLSQIKNLQTDLEKRDLEVQKISGKLEQQININDNLKTELLTVQNSIQLDPIIIELKKENDTLRLKEDISKDINNLTYERQKLNDAIEDLRDQKSGLDDTVSRLRSELQLNLNQFREKALSVLPFFEILNNVRNESVVKKLNYIESEDYFRPNNADELVHEIAERLTRQQYDANQDFKMLVSSLMISNKFIGIFGPPGTGKTTLATCLTRALTPRKANSDIIRVASGWSSHTDFLGYDNAFSGSFKYKTEFFSYFEEPDFVKSKELYTIIFDEATLSAPEYYLSDFLSNTDVVKESLVEIINFSGHKLYLPSVMKFILTFNVDETTVLLSDRMIDRMPIVYLNEKPDVENYNQGGIKEIDFLPIDRESLNKIFANLDQENQRFTEIEDEFDLRVDYWKKSIDIKVSQRKEQQIDLFKKFISNISSINTNIIVDFMEDVFLLPKVKGNGPNYLSNLDQLISQIKSSEAKKRLNDIRRIGSFLQSYRHV